MSVKALIVLAEGFEEVEAVTPIDILKRAGVHVTIAGIGSDKVKGSRAQIAISCDTTIEQIKDNFDAIILPGGQPGSSNLAASEGLKHILLKAQKDNTLIAAICAAPAVVLAPLGILDGKKATCFPGMEELFPESASFQDRRVVCDQNLITSRALGTALEFSLEIIKNLCGEDIYRKISQSTLAEL